MAATSEAAAVVELEIRGMHCAGCAGTVERALAQTPGVHKASVNLATERAHVEVHAQTPETVKTLTAAVKAAGYEARPVEDPAAGLRARQAERAAALARQRRRMIAATMLALPVIVPHLLSMIPPLAARLHEAGGWLHGLLGWVHTPAGLFAQGVLAAGVLLAGAGEIFAGALRGLLVRSANMDLLVTLGALTAFVSGVIGAIAGVPELVLFDAAALIVVFVSIGKYLEARARGAASRALELLAQRLPTTALRVVQPASPGAETVEPVPAGAVRVGDRLRLTPHAAVPVDGVLLTGQVTLDESMLTGESLPVEKRPGDAVFGGTQVLAGQADIRADATGADSAAARIAKLVEQAQTTKPPWQRLADRVAGVFVPAVLGLALLTFAGWWLTRPDDPFWALQRTIAVLVVACPCAMGLAIPTAVMVGTARAAERGILVRDAESLEAAGAVRTVLLDKTGTLTLGRPRLAGAALAEGVDEAAALRVAGALGQLSPHPLAQALTRAAQERGLALPGVTDFVSRPGEGVAGVLDGAEARSGSLEWVRAGGADTASLEARAAALAEAGQSVVWVAQGKRVLGVFGLTDEVHPESAGAIAELHRLGVAIRILSGDRSAAVASLAARLGVDAYEAQLTPDQKLERVRRLAGGRGGIAMVGDGVNDAPALAAADVGIAIGTGADVSREAAGICLVGHSPQRIADAIRLSRASARIMKQNLFWAFFYNVIMLPLAIFTPLPPALATAAMMFSSLSVVGNSLRLRAA